jgi:L-ascorbate metabolism protein UlaG (beta-lactamase superfamily)
MLSRILLALGAVAALSVQRDGVQITFLANEGVMLAADGKKVLIDGLFLKYETGYAVPADSTQTALAAARAPFDSVDLVLVTHRHGDHFHPAPVAAHLLANPRATLVTSSQVIDSLRGRLPRGAGLSSRIHPRTTAPGARRHEVVNGIAVELLGLPHASRRHRAVEHLAYIVELGGRRVLHVGDAEISEATLAPFRLDNARIDVALVPTWIITNPDTRRAVERWIRPKQVVGIHVGESDPQREAGEVRAAMPAAVTLTRSLETHRW